MELGTLSVLTVRQGHTPKELGLLTVSPITRALLVRLSMVRASALLARRTLSPIRLTQKLAAPVRKEPTLNQQDPQLASRVRSVAQVSSTTVTFASSVQETPSTTL